MSERRLANRAVLVQLWYRGRCWPWSHDWSVTRVSPPSWDISARGELWRCDAIRHGTHSSLRNKARRATAA